MADHVTSMSIQLWTQRWKPFVSSSSLSRDILVFPTPFAGAKAKSGFPLTPMLNAWVYDNSSKDNSSTDISSTSNSSTRKIIDTPIHRNDTSSTGHLIDRTLHRLLISTYKSSTGQIIEWIHFDIRRQYNWMYVTLCAQPRKIGIYKGSPRGRASVFLSGSSFKVRSRWRISDETRHFIQLISWSVDVWHVDQ